MKKKLSEFKVLSGFSRALYNWFLILSSLSLTALWIYLVFGSDIGDSGIGIVILVLGSAIIIGKGIDWILQKTFFKFLYNKGVVMFPLKTFCILGRDKNDNKITVLEYDDGSKKILTGW